MAGNDAKFTEGSLMRHVAVMSFTASIGLMAIFAVDLADMLFISMLGNAALAAAVGFAGTVLFFTTSISIGISIAAGALVARAIGAGQTQDMRDYATSALMMGLVISAGVVGVILGWHMPLLAALGAEGEVLELAGTYLRIILPSMPVMMAAILLSAVLRAHGDARRAMMATLIGGIVNAVLDPLFIFGFGWGLEGAAAASVVSRFTILFVALVPVLRVYDGLARPRLALLARDARAITGIAAPAIMANVATPVGSAIVLREMTRYGTDAVAGMAIIGRLTPVAFSVVFALSGAIGPILGQNFGAGNASRVREGFFAALKFSGAYVVVVSLILFALRGPIASAFGAEGVTAELIFLFCGPLALVWMFNGWIFVGNAAFNNLGHPLYSTWVNWGRNTLGTYPLVLLGGWMWGASGVLIGQAAGAVIFAAISIALAMRVMGRGKGPVHGFTGQQHQHIAASRRH